MLLEILYAKLFTIASQLEDIMADINETQPNILTKNNFLTVYPALLHRFSHMSIDLQDLIIADPTIVKLYQTREANGELDLNLDRQNDEQIEDQVNSLIEQFNED